MSCYGRAPLRKRRDALSLPILLHEKGMQFSTPGMLDLQHQRILPSNLKQGVEKPAQWAGGMVFCTVGAGMGAWARTARPALPGRGAAHRVQACLHPSLPPAAVWHCVASSAPGRTARSPFPLLVNSSVQLKKHKAFFPMTTLDEKGQKCLGITKEKDSYLNPFSPNIFPVINERYRPKALHVHTKLSMVNANLAASRALFY